MTDIGSSRTALHAPESAPADVQLQRALAFHQRGQLGEAEALYRALLDRPGERFDPLHMLGVIEIQRGNPTRAIELIDRALQLRPDSADALSNRGAALAALGRHQEALTSYDRALELRPDDARVLGNRGMALWSLGRDQEALDSCNRAVRLDPGNVEALNNRGLVLLRLKRHDKALESFERALTIRSDYCEAHGNRGAVLVELKQWDEALASFQRAMDLNPDDAETLSNRASALLALNRPLEALECCTRALQRKPDYPEALNNQGNALVALDRVDEAVSCYQRALAFRPGDGPALANLGSALGDLGRHQDAADIFAQLIAIAPDHEYALGRLFHARLRCCDWRHYREDCRRIVQAVERGAPADAPFTFLAVSDATELQLRCASTYVRDRHPPSPAPTWRGERYRHDRIRVAYVSADFRDHAVTCLTAGLFEVHDRNRFETIGISLLPEDRSAAGVRVRAAFERFFDVSTMSDREAAGLLRELEVDIAVDLTGFTARARTGILAHRPAPIQVNYLGFPATMGAEYIDYLIADRFVVPEDRRAHYAEKVVYLPDTFQANDDKRTIASRVPSRHDAGLPDSGFVFCSFNSSYKLNPRFFGAWMRVLRRVPGSVLWLVGESSSVRDNLRAEAMRRRVDPDRLVFAPRIGYPDHLARLGLADLFLDSMPFNAGTTASDALWAGVPVLTCAGESFAARMAGSLLHAVGLPQLITFRIDDYEALALRLATATNDLAGIRATLARNRTTAPLFDTDRFRRNIEAAYAAMWARHRRGELIASFAVDAPSEHG